MNGEDIDIGGSGGPGQDRRGVCSRPMINKRNEIIILKLKIFYFANVKKNCVYSKLRTGQHTIKYVCMYVSMKYLFLQIK